jgi:hypothetical protein
MREMLFDQETVCWIICLIGGHPEQDSGNWEGPSVSGKLPWSASDSSTASTPVSLSAIRLPNMQRNAVQ